MSTDLRDAPQPSLDGIEILGPMEPGFDEILTPAALGFIAGMARRFTPQVKDLLARRETRQREIAGGVLPDFLPETRQIRESDWTVGEIPADLQDRRVEITGPTDRKMIINALNSGAKVFMADCEDSLSPTWHNVVAGQINLRDAAARTIELSTPQGKHYALKDEIATLIVRPRGWHLVEKHLLVDGKPVPGGLVDFGLYLFHNAATLKEKGTGPYFYLPKLEGHKEAAVWAEVFQHAENALGLHHGTIKCTILIETLLAAFEMDEILYVLKDYIVGLNCGRWDYIFSYIKKFQSDPERVLPDRAEVTMTRHFMHSYSLLAIKTCHARGALAIGGMAAQIPIKNDPEANAAALDKVRQDKLREATDGHDGTWVAHPGLVPIAMEIFDEHMPQPNQVDRLRRDVEITAADLLKVPGGSITEQGLRTNISVGIQYLAAWLSGNGCVPLYNLMEDAATAEISRAQVWQWIRHPKGVLEDGRRVTAELVATIKAEEMVKIRGEVGDAAFAAGNYERAGELFDDIIRSDDFPEFLTLGAYQEFE